MNNQITESVYHIRIVEIKNKLSPLNLQKFRASCFGYFLDLQEIETHSGLLRLITNSVDEECFGARRLSFMINNAKLHIGPSEFYFLTGLKFKGGYDTPHTSDMLEELFGGKRDLTFIDVKIAFEKQCNEDAGTGDNVLRLAMLYMLYGVLVYRDDTMTNVDLGHVHLVADLNRFNAYPWGRIAYDNFVGYTQSVSKLLKRTPREASKLIPLTKHHGMDFVLQIWAFEVMPDLCLWPWAIQRRRMMRISPRILRWAVMPYSTSAEFKIDFTHRDVKIMNPIRPSYEESESWELWGIHFSSAECARIYSNNPLPNLNEKVLDMCTDEVDGIVDTDITLPAWEQIRHKYPPEEMHKAWGTKYIIKEIYGTIDEAIVKMWRKQDGLQDLSHKLKNLLLERNEQQQGPSTPIGNRMEKRRRT